jgi:hypothetical protein
MLRIVISFISTIIFGFLEGIIFLTYEEEIQKQIQKLKFFDLTSAEIFVGGTSTATAIFFTTYLEKYIEDSFDIIKHPAIDSIGIIIGTFIVILLYKLYKYIYKLEEGKKRLNYN